MKKTLIFWFLGCSCPVLAGPDDAHAEVVYIEKATQKERAVKVWLTAASTTNIEYKIAPKAQNRVRLPRIQIRSIYFFEPLVFKEALEAYENRDYACAKEKFETCRTDYKKIDNLPGNYSTLAGFYEIECCRKLWDLEGLKERLDRYRSEALVRENQRNQLEIYPLWDAVRTKAWPRLTTLAQEVLSQRKWTGEQLAQIKYCQGLALDSLGSPREALNAFNWALTADRTASEIITKRAAMNCFRIFKNHDEVKLAIRLWGTEEEDPDSAGHRLLQEAGSLCALWKSALGRGQPLPAEYAVFLKFKK